MNEWKPIEYAKTQDRYFLLFSPDEPRWAGNMDVGKWFSSCFWSCGGPNGGLELLINFTHCMELPEDPVIATNRPDE